MVDNKQQVALDVDIVWQAGYKAGYRMKYGIPAEIPNELVQTYLRGNRMGFQVRLDESRGVKPYKQLLFFDGSP